MFTAAALLALLRARPFVPFRMVLSDGGTVEVLSSELVFPGRQHAIVGLLDPGSTDTLHDRWLVVWYMHVTRVEMLASGAAPLATPPSPPGSPTPSAT
jgi:hypothetical protein